MRLKTDKRFCAHYNTTVSKPKDVTRMKSTKVQSIENNIIFMADSWKKIIYTYVEVCTILN